MSAITRAHRAHPNPLTRVPDDLTVPQMVLVVLIVLGCSVLAMHLLGQSSGWSW